MLNGLGEALEAMYKLMMTLLIIFVPLGLWKMVDIVIYLIEHIQLGWK